MQISKTRKTKLLFRTAYTDFTILKAGKVFPFYRWISKSRNRVKANNSLVFKKKSLGISVSMIAAIAKTINLSIVLTIYFTMCYNKKCIFWNEYQDTWVYFFSTYIKITTKLPTLIILKQIKTTTGIWNKLTWHDPLQIQLSSQNLLKVPTNDEDLMALLKLKDSLWLIVEMSYKAAQKRILAKES